MPVNYIGAAIDIINHELGYDTSLSAKISSKAVRAIYCTLIRFSKYLFYFVTTYFLLTSQVSKIRILGVWKQHDHPVTLAISAFSLLLTYAFTVTVFTDFDEVSKGDENRRAIQRERNLHAIDDLIKFFSFGYFTWWVAPLLLEDPTEVTQQTFLLSMKVMYCAMTLRQAIFWVYFMTIARDNLEPWSQKIPDEFKGDFLQSTIQKRSESGKQMKEKTQ